MGDDPIKGVIPKTTELIGELVAISAKLDALSEDVNMDAYRLKSSDACVVLGRLRSADVVVRDCIAYLGCV